MILYGKEARDKLMEGINLVAKTVKPTLGPQARTVVLQNNPPIIINDGVTIAKHIHSDDPFIEMGVKLIQEVASQAQDTAGDGTTTASILAESLCKAGLKLVEDGQNPVLLKKIFDEEINMVCNQLQEMALPVTDENIEKVATIAANNDEELGNLIKEVLEKVGRDGVITVEPANAIETSYDIIEGLELNRGMISNLMVNNEEKGECILTNPVVLMTNSEIKNFQDILPILEIAVANKRPLLIMCGIMEGNAITNLLINIVNKSVECAVIKAPNFGDESIQEMTDISSLIGGTVFDETIDLDFSNATFDDLGQCNKIIVSQIKTTIMVEGNNPTERIKILRSQLDNAPNTWLKDRIQTRIGKLAGGVAVIKVGGATEIEMKERTERLDDALNATKAAIQDGIVVGGGLALYVARNILPDGIVKKTLAYPIEQIADNAGHILQEKRLDYTIGYNALTGEYEDLYEAGILDPVKVTLSSLRAAGSIAGLVLTTEALVGEYED
jgi:chaperonin GroEL